MYEELEKQKIKEKEELEALNKIVSNIKDLLDNEENKSDLEALIQEIEFYINEFLKEFK